MNSPRKIVPRSKLAEWRGLDRIAWLVHGMQCIWREQQKDDIGIDGEIELCRPREDGDGLIGTGKIVKVQSKSGSSYIIRDSETSFSSPVSEKDLRYWDGMNLPIIYIVYHPDDDLLYWKDLKTYLADRSDVWTPPYRIDFDKSSDHFCENAYRRLCALFDSAPERVSTEVGETLYTNLLEVLELPPRVWVTPVLPEKQPRFHDRLAGIIPPYVYKSGMLITLTDPSATETALKQVVEPGAEEFELDDWLSQDDQNENDLRALLNRLLHRHLRRLGLDYQKETHRYFFNKGLAEDAPLHRSWISARTGRTHQRTVAKHYTYGKSRFFRHRALQARFERFGRKWAVAIRPALHFSLDGKRPWEGDVARSFAIRARAEQYNDLYLNDVLFWSYQLARGEKAFHLRIDDEPLALVGGAPLTVEAAFSIQSASSSTRKQI